MNLDALCADIIVHRRTEDFKHAPGIPVITGSLWSAKQRVAHSLHEISYRACFKPALPQFFIERLTLRGQTVLDPWMGRGTTVLEAALLGRRGLGNDINPLCAHLLRGRLQPPTHEEVRARLSEIDLDIGFKKPAHPDYLEFFHPETFRQIRALRHHLTTAGERTVLEAGCDAWLMSVALNRLTGHSEGFFSTYTMPPNQAVSAVVQRKLNQRLGYLPPEKNVVNILLKKTKSLLSGLTPEQRVQLHAQEPARLTSTSAATLEIESNSVDLVVTSPPFLDTVDYRKDNWLRNWFAKVDNTTLEGLTQEKDLELWSTAMRAALIEMRRVLVRGAYVAIEVGEVRRGKVKLEASIVPAGVEAGLTPLAVLINDSRFTKTAQCWGIENGKKGTNTNRIVLFQKS